jgi:hypothetical protein
MRRDLHPTDLRGDQDVFVGLRSSQGACRIQLGQLIFEHTFNIRLGTGTAPTIRRATANGQHLTDPDNICAHVRPGRRLGSHTSAWSCTRRRVEGPMITADMIDQVTRFDGGRLSVVSAYLGLYTDPQDRRSLSTRASSLLHERNERDPRQVTA